MSDNQEKFSPEFWAKKLAALLTPEEFSDFALFLDGCDDADFSYEVARIDCERNPHLYINPDVEEKEEIVVTSAEECETCHFTHAENPSEADEVHRKLSEQDADCPEK